MSKPEESVAAVIENCIFYISVRDETVFVVSLPGYCCGLMFYTVTALNYCSLLELINLSFVFAVDV